MKAAMSASALQLIDVQKTRGNDDIVLATGVAMILTTIMVGQLTAQVNAANCMLDFINNYFMLFTSYVSLGIEFSGLVHCVYLVQIIFSKITGKPIESNEPPRSGVQMLFFWVRVVMSLAILGFSLAAAFTVNDASRRVGVGG